MGDVEVVLINLKSETFRNVYLYTLQNPYQPTYLRFF
jgi:hypothetical protein